jgi:hypothetical protein
LAYRAPETFVKGAPNTGKIDTYSVGIVFYEILTLTHPLAKFITSNADIADWIHAHRTEIPDDPKLLRQDTPPTVGSLILRMMGKLPAERPEWEEVLRILGSSREPVRPRRLDPKIVALLEQSASEVDKARIDRARRQATEVQRREQGRSEIDNATVIASRKLAEFDEYISELNEVRPDHRIEVSKPNEFERIWRLLNGREVRCAFWMPSGPISTKRGRLVVGGFVGVDGGLSLNLALMATPDGKSHHWVTIRGGTHPLYSEDTRLRIMRQVGLSRETIGFMQGEGIAAGWMRDMPFHFGIPSDSICFSHAGGIGEQDSLDLHDVGSDLEKDFERIIECAMRMPRLPEWQR